MWLSLAPMPLQPHLGEQSQAWQKTVHLCGPVEKSTLAQVWDCPSLGWRSLLRRDSAEADHRVQIAPDPPRIIQAQSGGLGCGAACMAWELSAEEPVCMCEAVWVCACLWGGAFGGTEPQPCSSPFLFRREQWGMRPLIPLSPCLCLANLSGQRRGGPAFHGQGRARVGPDLSLWSLVGLGISGEPLS